MRGRKYAFGSDDTKLWKGQRIRRHNRKGGEEYPDSPDNESYVPKMRAWRSLLLDGANARGR